MKTIMLTLLLALIGCGQKENKLSANISSIPKLEATTAQSTFQDELKISLNSEELKAMDRNESIHFISRIMFQKSQRGLKSDKKLVRKLIHYPRVFQYEGIDLENIDQQVYQYALSIEALKGLEVLDGLQYGLLSIDNHLKSFNNENTLVIYRNDYQQNDLIYNREVDNSEITNLKVSSSREFNSNSLISYIEKININGMSFEEEIKNKSEEVLITLSSPIGSKNIYLKDDFKNLKELIIHLDSKTIFDDYGNIRRFMKKENQLDDYQRRDAVPKENFTWQFFTDKPLDINSTINPGDHIFMVYDQIKNFETIELLKFKTIKESVVISSSPYQIQFKTNYSKFKATYKIDKVMEPTTTRKRLEASYYDNCGRICEKVREYCNYYRLILSGHKNASNPMSHIKNTNFDTNNSIIPVSIHNRTYPERNEINSCTRRAGIGENRTNKNLINTMYGKLEAELTLNF